MKYYNVEGYVRHKLDLEETLKNMKHEIMYDIDGNVDYTQMFDSSIIKMWMPLCESLARKFATSQQASGVMAITDMIQEGHVNLIKAVDRIDWNRINESEDAEKTLKLMFACASKLWECF